MCVVTRAAISRLVLTAQAELMLTSKACAHERLGLFVLQLALQVQHASAAVAQAKRHSALAARSGMLLQGKKLVHTPSTKSSAYSFSAADSAHLSAAVLQRRAAVASSSSSNSNSDSSDKRSRVT